MTARILACSIALTLLLASASTLSAAEAEPAHLEPFEFETFSGETVAAERGSIVVPENRSEPDGKQLKLVFVRFPSTAADPGPPIVYLAGGPGGSGIDAARSGRFALFEALRAYGDVIAFDQRGTGDSEGDLSCQQPYMLAFDEPLDRESAMALASAALGRCFEELRQAGHDPTAYNTIESAADLMALREALGADKLVLWGISYGSHLGLATLKYHGEHVAKAVLAGVEPLHHSFKLPSDQQTLLEEIARQAAANPTTKDAVPDLLGSIERLLAQLEAEPVTQTFKNPMNGMTVKITVGKLDLQIALASMLRGPAEFAAMPDTIARMEAGDWVGLGIQSAGQRLGGVRRGMSTAMDCGSGLSESWRERIAAEAEGTLLGDAINLPFPDICSEIVADVDLGDEFRAPVESEVPVLLISGTLDGRTPPANAEEVLPGLPNAKHLVIAGGGHGDLFQSDPAILETMEAFVAGEPLPHERIDIGRVDFIAPRTVAEVSEDVLAHYAGEYQINSNESRVVIQAGSQLYTRRGSGQPFPIRPMSETEFFYEGSATWLRFELDDKGQPIAMVVHHNGAEEGERAVKADE